MGNLDDLLDLVGCQLAVPLHRKPGRTALVDTRNLGGEASEKGVHMPKSKGPRFIQEFKAEAV
jgi:hypothetical protein